MGLFFGSGRLDSSGLSLIPRGLVQQNVHGQLFLLDNVFPTRLSVRWWHRQIAGIKRESLVLEMMVGILSYYIQTDTYKLRGLTHLPFRQGCLEGFPSDKPIRKVLP